MKIALACTLLLVALPALAAPPTVQQIINRDGRFVFSDGSSYYSLEKDGSFHSGPLGMSGRTIDGRWKPDGSSRFVIEGRWSWLNGLSATNDRRRMAIGVSGLLAPAKQGKPLGMLKPVKGPVVIHSCYFVIDELVRLPKK
jgi:hypothetical protein